MRQTLRNVTGTLVERKAMQTFVLRACMTFHFHLVFSLQAYGWGEDKKKPNVFAIITLNLRNVTPFSTAKIMNVSL